MVSLQKIDDSSVKFVFTDSDHYLVGNGEIVVPINSLSLVIDESEMVTFKKSATGDPFLSFRADNSNLGTKEAIEEFYKENMVGDSGISQEEVQDMIDSAMSGVPSSQVVEQLRTDVNTISGNTYTKTQIDGFLSNAEGMLTAISGEVQTNSANIQDIYDTIDEKEEVIASALTEVRQDVSEIDAKEEVIASALTEVRQDVSEIDAKEEVIASALTEVRQDVNTLSGDVNTLSGAVIDNEYTVSQSLNDLNSRKLDASAYTPTDLSQYWTSAQTQSAIDDAKAYYIDFTTLTTQGIHDADWDGMVAAINAHRPIYAGLQGANGLLYYTAECLYQDGSNIIRMTASDNAAHYFYTFTKNGSENYSFSYATKPYVPDITTAITSGSTDSEIPTAKATYDAIQAGGGGGATYSAGTNISIDTANTINCTLPIEKLSLTSNQDENYKCLWINPSNIKIWISNNTPSTSYLNYLRPAFSFGVNTIKAIGHPAAFGQMNTLNGFDSFATGDYNNTNNNYEFATGRYNNSVNDSTASGQTLFSVGNGASASARHNAFEIRQNGDIYVNDGTNDVKLQDTITATASNTTALGGLKLVKIYQAEYDALATKENDTLYIIPDGDSNNSHWEQ